MLVDIQGFFDEYVGASLLWMKINVVPIVSVEDVALVQVSERLRSIARNKLSHVYCKTFTLVVQHHGC